MIFKRRIHRATIIQKCDGFTLTEAMMSMVILAVMAMGISMVFFSGLKSLDQQDEHMLLASQLRSQMEWLLSQPFDSISSGSQEITVKSQNHTLTWTVTTVDLNQDAKEEANAKQITVFVAGLTGYSLTTLVVDHEGKVGKL
jgi:prepilin-type N-terminal cleavage/methylation domain-containing protein